MKKTVLFPIIYWLIFLVIVFIVFPLFLRDGSLLIVFLFFYPLVFIIPFKISKLEDIRTKLKVAIGGFIIPFIILYSYFLVRFINDFHPGF